VAEFAHQIARFLVDEHDVKLLVVACNTAAAAALDALRAELDVPVLGVIGPGVRSLVRATQTGRVGVIGTVGTVGRVPTSRRWPPPPHRSSSRWPPAPASWSSSSEVRRTATRCTCWPSGSWPPWSGPKVDALLLGCTHYPYLARTLTDVVGRDVVLVSSADETAFEAYDLFQAGGTPDGTPLRSADPGRVGEHRFFSSGDVDRFQDLGARLLGPELVAARRTPWAR
jgi:glutamate racemase